MTFKRACSPCLFLCLAALTSTARAQNTATPASGGYGADTSGYATAGDFSGSYLFGNDGGTYFLFDKMVGDGPGYTEGYSRFGLRAKLFDTGDSHAWSSAYALITDENRVGVNLGGGYRWLFDSNVLSLHGWFDSYETDNGFRYDQVSAGIEVLHEELDMRVNGYLPIGETENFFAVTDPGTESVFTSRGIGFLGRGLDEQALKGIDAEVGVGVFGVNWARVYGGGYWYDGKNTSFGGARGRVETAISPDLSLNFVVQNDTEFNTNYQMSVEYRFSGGLSPGFFTPFHGEARKYNPVRRTWPVATQAVEIDATIPMLNPRTGQVLTATFVDNTNTEPGDGSYENPFRELPSSDPADLILVFAGNGATVGNIELIDYQQLLGEGKLYTFQDPIRGTVTLPTEFASSGPRPTLRATDPNQNVITLADWNRVANFGILGPAPAAIGGSDITGFTIDMVNAGNVTDGVRIVNASGTGIIRNSGFNAADEGIFVSNTSGGLLNLLIEGTSVAPLPNPLQGLTTLGGNDGIHVRANGADINLTMRNIAVNNAANRGVTVDSAFGAQVNADIDNTIVYNTGGTAGDGFNFNVVEGSSMALDMDTVAARGDGDLLVVDVRDSNFVGSVTTSDFSDSGTGSGVRMNLVNATGRLLFDDLVANRNAVNGIEVDATGAGTDFFLSVIDSRLLANMGSGMHLDITGGADFRHFVDPTFVVQSGGSGLEYNVSGAGSVYIADIIATDFSESSLHAVDGYVFDGAFANVDLMNTPGQLAGLNGYNLVVEQNADFVGTVTGAQFNGAADSAIDVSAINGSTINLTMTDILGQGNGDYGLRYLTESNSQMFLGITDADFNSNPDSNIVGTSRGAGSLASVYLNNVTADGSAADGAVVLTAEDGGVLNQQWNGGTASQGDANGVLAMVDGAGSQMRLGFNGVNIGTNAMDGIDATLTNGGANSILDITLVNSSVSQNGGNGLDLSISGPGARSVVTIDNTPMGGNFSGDAFEFDVLNGAGLRASAFGAATQFAQNGERGWHGTVDGAGSFANLFFDGTSSVQNGLEGGLFNVTGGGQLNANLSNLIVSQNLLDGIRTNVDGVGSVARFTLEQVNIQQNGLSLLGDGFEAIATGGGQVMATLSDVDVSVNRESGLRFDASGGSSMLIQMDNVIADSNGRHGLEYHVSSGGGINLTTSTSSFSGNGTSFVGNGVWATANGAGSLSNGTFLGVVADDNDRMGFEFDVRTGATLIGDIRSDAMTFGNSSGSGNGINGVRFNAQDAGTMGFLLMSGANTFDGNLIGDGVNFDAVGVNMAVANVTGSANDNGADGIDIRMINVDTGAISLDGEGTGTITGNAGNGIEITTQNVNLVEKTVNGITIPAFQVEGFTINGNGGDPLIVNMINTTFPNGEISGNTITGGVDGINVSLEGGAGDLLIDDNTISDVTRYGIVVTSGAGMHQVGITNNTVTNSGNTNIFVDLFGTTQTGLMIDGNTLTGGGFNDGIHVDVRENAFLTDSTINENIVQMHGDDGIEVVVADTADVGVLMMNENEVAGNGGDGIRFETASANQLAGLVISENSVVNGNGGDGIEVSINALDPAMVPDILVEANMVAGNMGDGIRVDVLDSSVDDVSVSLNTVTGNMGDGVVLNIDNMTGGVINADAVMVSSNMIQGNGGDGLFVNLNNLTGLRSVDMQMSTVAENMGRGVVFQVNNSPIEEFNISDNSIVNNALEDALLVDVAGSPIDVLTLERNQIGGAADDGIDLRLDGSPVGDLQINNNSIGMVMGMMNSGTPIDDSLPVIRTGFDTNNLPANDDGSTGLVPIGFGINFFGQMFTDTFVNNNGNITFTGPLGTFTPFNLLSTATPIIAPFFADVDTRAGNIVTFGPGMVATQTAFGVNWPGVRHFSALGANMGLPENIFQLVLIDRSDIGVGDFDVEFNYEQILWEAGTASGSNEMGLGGSSARAGLSNGVDFALELAGSAVNGAFLDGGPGATSLIQNNLNSVNDGRYIFFFRDGSLGEAAPSGGTGLEVTVVNGSDIGNMQMVGNTIDGNGLHGVDITVQDSMLPTASTIEVSGNTITNHENGDGFRLVNPDTNDTAFEIDFTGNTIGLNGGVGLNIALNAESGGMTTTLTGNDISDNGGIGASFVAAGDSNLDLTFGDSAAAANTLTANGDAGIGIETQDSSVANITVVNTTVTGSMDGSNVNYNGEGLAVHSNGTSVIESMTVGDSTLNNTSFDGNLANGIEIDMAENHRNPNLLIQNVTANDNINENGISITRSGFSTLSEDLDSDGVMDPGEDVNGDGMLGHALITGVTANNNDLGAGLGVTVSGASQPLQILDVTDSTFNGNNLGVDFVVNNDASLLTNLTNNVINGNTSHGVSVVTNQNAAFGNMFPSGGNPNSPLAVPSTFSSNIISGNGGHGLNLVANDASVQAVDVDDTGAVNASNGTSRSVFDGNGGNQVQVAGNGTSQQNIDLVAVTMTNSAAGAVGNGVNIDANATSTVDVSISGGASGASIIGQMSPMPGVGFDNGIDADVAGQAILNLNVADTNIYGNTGDGINLSNVGPNNTGNQAGGSGERQTIQATFNNVDARFNGDQGIEADLNGNIGGRAAQLDTDMPVLLSINNSNFSSNTNEGIFFRADAGLTHGGDQFYADQVVTFNVANSIIQGNGMASISNGLVMEVGTNAYVLSSITGNMFGANGADDFTTSSFDSGAGNNSAALDLRFQNNSGDHIRPTAIGATAGTTFFVLDNSLTVEANNNFQLFGVPQMEVFGPDGFAPPALPAGQKYLLRVISNHGSNTFPPVP